ncbi:MAG: DUF1552 domain-containing protein [Verrucomicrobiales bacterium]
MNEKTSTPTRRHFLKGLGVSLALPFFDSLSFPALAKGTVDGKPPVRLGFMYMPHGVIMDEFWPKDPASFLKNPPPALRSLQPVLNQCLMMKGISGVPIAPFNGAPHALELSTWLTAQLPDAPTRHRVNIGISADQIAANYLGPLTSLPSLELATMPQTHKENQEGLHEAYYSHCSYRSATRPVPAMTNPRAVLKRLFGQQSQGDQRTQADPLDQKMLDLVLDGAKDLRKTLPYTDRQKLDEYLDGVRSVERRIAAFEHRQKEAALEKNGLSSRHKNASDSPPIEIKIPEGGKRSEYMRVMCDLNVLAFQTDLTRVSTYIGSTPNGVNYPELGFRNGHHGLTHHKNDAEQVRKVAAITAFNIEQYAYMIKRMSQLREGEGSLLDNCIMMWGSGLEDGDRHSRENLPFIIAGGGGGSIETGKFLTGIKGNQGDLLTTLLGCVGVPLDSPLGIATKEISQIRRG